ncbi:Patatin [Shimia thalassica]|uniref:Patatin n=1 Tax=Shimia thalassica TaxID=1715693 RepID=A0A0P1IIU3_9RHOB|nr:patatin-like phospholipase family protein [Shimia thalassica]CUK15060.1 Patatin [Shimia thalassica]
MFAGTKTVCGVLGFFILFGCGGQHDRTSVAPPAATYESFAPAGYPHPIRVYEDADGDELGPLIEYYETDVLPPSKSTRKGGLNILALSGGGQDGAFGAGILTGWTQMGKRPVFDIVTGISTGALIAPFAFLGPEYDDQLRHIYTQTSTSDIARFDVMGAIFGRGYVASTRPLAQSIENELDDAVIRAIAKEARNGRSLIIGTTNIDAERPVLWDIGAMAQVDTQESHDLIRKVVLASASIPLLFEPVSIPVTDGTTVREELHVDGGLTREIFVYPPLFDMRAALSRHGLASHRNTIWLIHNKRLEQDYKPQSTRLKDMASRTLAMLIRSQSIGNIASIGFLAKRDGLHANLQSIPASFEAVPKEVFDPEYMSSLFQTGYQLGSNDEGWWMDIQNYYD